MGGTSLGVKHLLCVTVVGGNEKDVAGFLTCFVDGGDSFVGMSDSFYSCVEDTSVAHLHTDTISYDEQ